MGDYHEESNGKYRFDSSGNRDGVGVSNACLRTGNDGIQGCSSNQQYGVTTVLNGAGATSSTSTTHTLGSTHGFYIGFGPKSTSRFGVSSGSYIVYTPTPATFNSITGFCMPKGN
jgi:hypothetical protein